MCDGQRETIHSSVTNKIPVDEAVGMVLAHDITEIRKDEFKGRAFRKGHVVRKEDVCHLQRLGKEHLFVLNIGEDEVHENDAAYAFAKALMGEGVRIQGEPREGKINIVADRDGLLKIDKEALLEFNMTGDAMCATLHDNTPIKKDRIVAGTRAIPLVISKWKVEDAVNAAVHIKKGNGSRRTGVIEVKKIKRPRVGVVITGNEVFMGRIKDEFAPVISEKVRALHGDIAGIYYAPDDEEQIEARLRELIKAGTDLLITTGGMSVDPDDVTRFAIRRIGAEDIIYGSAVLPGAMFLVAYLDNSVSSESTRTEGQVGIDSNRVSGASETLEPDTRHLIPVLGIPACAMYHRATVMDLILPRVLTGERIGRKELAELGHGGLCLHCDKCRFPVCPFGK
jgi:hypothetical protein